VPAVQESPEAEPLRAVAAAALRCLELVMGADALRDGTHTDTQTWTYIQQILGAKNAKNIHVAYFFVDCFLTPCVACVYVQTRWRTS
jgi:hypothetical protein